MTHGSSSARHRLYPEHLCRIKRILVDLDLWVIEGGRRVNRGNEDNAENI
jgi:hypothetical protein